MYGNVYRLKLVRLERIGFCFFFRARENKTRQCPSFSFSWFLRIRIGVGFWTPSDRKITSSSLCLSLSFERAKVRGSFSTPSNECKRVHATTDRPTDAGKRRERCSLRATRENDAKNLLRKITTRENLPTLWEREKIETKTRKQTKARVSYLDDGAQTSRGWCNPPGASPDTINRSSRPRLSRANRRCPELRSVTRTPFTAESLWICVRVFGHVPVGTSPTDGD